MKWDSRWGHDAVATCAFQNEHIGYDELDAFFVGKIKKLADKCGMQCWINAETFDYDMPIDFLSIKFDKLRMKLEVAKWAVMTKLLFLIFLLYELAVGLFAGWTFIQ